VANQSYSVSASSPAPASTSIPSSEGSLVPSEAADGGGTQESHDAINVDSDFEEQPVTKKAKKTTSKVWQYFTKSWVTVEVNGKKEQQCWAKCNFKGCKNKTSKHRAESNFGTTAFWTHLANYHTFVPDLVRTEAQRAQRFIDGIYPAVRHNIVGHGTQTYARAVSIAQKVDASIRREAIRDCPQPFAPAQSSTASPALPVAEPTKEKKRKGKGAQTDRRTRQRQQQVPQCPTCGRFHRGECRFGQDICYYCHELRHFANRCPKKAHQPQQPQQPQQQQLPRAMSGMIMLNNVPVFALFDTGATHSFISRRCLDAIRVHAITAVDPLEVSLASGRKIVTSARASDLSLSIGGRSLSADAYVLEMRDFDLILGMDWLSIYHADIRCHDREITLYLPGDDSITFFGSKNRSLPHVVSMAKSTKLLRRGNCQGYLVSLVDDSQKARSPHDVPVVREFVDVFPDELPEGPPNRQVEFSIDLIPGAGPVSKAQYRMAPKELQELKAQIQELLRLDFIRPSVSPWGAPVLFVKKKDRSMSMCIDYRD
ncbi:Unknown protein, partial [Striga hermonthica]